MRTPRLSRSRTAALRAPVAALAALALVATAAPAAAQPEPLTLEAALAAATAGNEIPGIAEARLARAEALRRQAISALMPSLTVTGTYTRRPREITREIDGDTVTVQAIDALSGQALAETTLFDLRALPLVRAARSEVEAQRLDSAELLRALAHDVATGYYTVLGAERLVAATEERVRVAQATLDEAKLRLEAGLAGRNDVTRTELELATARLAATRAASGVTSSRLSLGFLIGEEIDDRPLVEPGDPPLPEGGRDAWIADAQGARRDIAALAERAAEAEHLARVPRYALLPRLDARGTYRMTNESGLSGRREDWNVALGLTWELFDGGTRRAVAAQRDAEATEARLQLDRLRRQVALEVADAATALDTAEASVDQAATRSDAARANAAEVRERYSAGLATVLEQADAAVEQFEAEVELVRQRYERALARLAVARALGEPPLPAAASNPEPSTSGLPGAPAARLASGPSPATDSGSAAEGNRP